MIERTFIQQNFRKIQLEEYLRKELHRAGFTHLEIEKTPMVTRIILHVTRPGLAIGKGGKSIKILTRKLEEEFGIKNPQIEIEPIERPELNARAMVDLITTLLERGYSWRSVAYRTVEDIMNAGAQGVELIIKGKLAGKSGRKRKERIAKGYMKKVGNEALLVDYAQGAAYPKVGAIGVKLRIVRPETVFTDKVDLEKLLKEHEVGEKAEGKESKPEKEIKPTETKKEEEKQGEKEKAEKTSKKKIEEKQAKNKEKINEQKSKQKGKEKEQKKAGEKK
jgi:small subunit ribosomal protein S3